MTASAVMVFLALASIPDVRDMNRTMLLNGSMTTNSGMNTFRNSIKIAKSKGHNIHIYLKYGIAIF